MIKVTETKDVEVSVWEKPELVRLDAADAQGLPGAGTDSTGSRTNQHS